LWVLAGFGSVLFIIQLIHRGYSSSTIIVPWDIELLQCVALLLSYSIVTQNKHKGL